MKNAKYISVAVVGVMLIIAVIVLVVVNFNMKSDKEAQSYYQIIEEKLIEENARQDLSDYKTFYYIDKYGMKTEENKVYLYCYVNIENYYKNEEGKVVFDSGSAIPHRFEFENGEYVGYEIPLDGSYYESSLNELFPMSIRMKMDISKDEEKMQNNIKQQVEEYYQISYNEVVF